MHGNILIISITGLLGNFSRAMIFPYASLYILALGGNAAQIGFINSLSPLLGLLLFPMAGYLADHAGRVKLIVLANFLSAGTTLLYVIAPSWELIAVAALLRGVAVLQFPARSAIIADSLAPTDRGRGMATMNTIYGTLSIFAPFIAGTIIEVYGANLGMRLLYAAMMLLYTASAVIQLRYLQETSPNAATRVRLAEMPGVLRRAYSGIPAMLRRLPRSLKAQTLVIILTFMANGIASPFWVVYAVEEIGLSSATWGFVLLVETTVRNVAFIPAGFLVDRWGRTAALRTALLLALLATPSFVFARGYIAVLLVRILIALARATAQPASTALMADTVPRDMRGRVMSAIGQGSLIIGAAGGGTGGPGVGFITTIPLMLSLLAGGYLYAANPRYPWYFAAAAMALALTLALFFIRDAERAEV